MTINGDTLFFIVEILGTIAFAISGAMIAIDRDLDIFGVIILGCMTACGGGILRGGGFQSHAGNAQVSGNLQATGNLLHRTVGSALRGIADGVDARNVQALFEQTATGCRRGVIVESTLFIGEKAVMNVV